MGKVSGIGSIQPGLVYTATERRGKGLEKRIIGAPRDD